MTPKKNRMRSDWNNMRNTATIKFLNSSKGGWAALNCQGNRSLYMQYALKAPLLAAKAPFRRSYQLLQTEAYITALVPNTLPLALESFAATRRSALSTRDLPTATPAHDIRCSKVQYPRLDGQSFRPYRNKLHCHWLRPPPLSHRTGC